MGSAFRYGGGTEAASTPEAYWQWLEPIHREAMRVLKPGGFSAWWQAHLNFRHFWDWFGPDVRVYAACKNFVQSRGSCPIQYAYDPVIFAYKAAQGHCKQDAAAVDGLVGR